MGPYLTRLAVSKEILRGALLVRSMWSAEEWWAEKMLPSRQRKLTQPQREQLARLLRALRLERSLEERARNPHGVEETLGA